MGKYFSEAKKLVEQMTLREKIGQITQHIDGYNSYYKTSDGIELNKEFKSAINYFGGIGAISGLLRADPWTKKDYGTGIEIHEREESVKKVQDYIKENTRLGIPALIEIEACHGMQALGSVMYPVNCCTGSSFNPELYEEVMEEVGKETVLSGNHVPFVPVIDLARDPRWGRSEECFGEDAFHAACFAKKAMEGLKKSGTLPCAKHFFGTGGTEGGKNAREIPLGMRTLKDFHLQSAKAAVDGGADFIMTAYNSIDGIPCHVNKEILQDILRKELKYEGIILSDGGGVPVLAQMLGVSSEDAAVMALEAGIELSLCDNAGFVHLEEAVLNGKVNEELIDKACCKVIEKKYEAGLFEDKPLMVGGAKEFVEDGHCDKLAYKMAAESIVMLKNNGICPVDESKKICLLGENADSVYYLLGDYTSGRKSGEGVSVKQAFEETFKNVSYAKGWSFKKVAGEKEAAMKIAAESDVICLCMGGNSARDFTSVFKSNGAMVNSKSYIDCGEGRDVSDLSLPKTQTELIKELKKLNKPIIAILIQGRAYAIPEVKELADAIMVAWYPGQQGARALADCISGKVNPSGRLSVSIPSESGVLPVCYNTVSGEKTYFNNEETVLYPFGYGMSYSSFKYLDLKVRKINDDNFEAEIYVENTSDICGKETVQLYVHMSGGYTIRPPKELKAFKKIEIKAHEKKKVTFNLKKEDFAVHNADGDLEVLHKNIKIYIGSDSTVDMYEEIRL